VAKHVARHPPVDPNNETALFFLGKADINYVWLHLGPLGRKTGWMRSKGRNRRRRAQSQRHVRARVARLD
jgi:hypothetical protein